MKKIILLPIVAILLVWASCINSQKKDTQPDGNDTIPVTKTNPQNALATAFQDILYDLCKDEAGGRNFRVSETEGITMITDFENIYRKGNSALKSEVWIDSCIIGALADFLEKSTAYDGVWIYNGADEGNEYKSSVLLIPTVPAGRHSHIPPEVMFPDCSNTNTEYRLHRLPITEKQKWMRKFNKEHRKATNENDYNTAKDSAISMGMWVHECVIKTLAKALRNQSLPGLKLDGVRVHSAAYASDLSDKPAGFDKPPRSTFILTLTADDGARGHQTIWIPDEAFKNKPEFSDGYNHGDLCPDYCP